MVGFRHREEVETAASTRGRHSPLSPTQLLTTDPLIADAVLTEGGRFAGWLDERAALLPSDEAMLAGQWALIGRSVYEVTEIRLDEGLTLRDVRTGDIVDVDERSGTRDVSVGEHLLARPLPTGSDRLQVFGGLTSVPDQSLGRFIAALDDGVSANELMRIVAAVEAPPKVANRDYEAAVYGDDDGDVPGMLDPADAPPEIRAAVRAQMDAYEEAWVDESLPALGGITPREALEDPTRRGDLFRLLDQMERQDAPLSEERRALGMRTARLRELLGEDE